MSKRMCKQNLLNHHFAGFPSRIIHMTLLYSISVEFSCSLSILTLRNKVVSSMKYLNISNNNNNNEWKY